MSAFATLAAVERRLYLDQVATRLGVAPVIVEKDFWVCWILQRIFATPALAADVVFKGGRRLPTVLESEIVSVLGAAPAGAQWLSYAIDPVAATPNLWFEYPSVLPQPGGYVAKRVKLEIGALTRKQPTGTYSITPLLADALGMAFDDFSRTSSPSGGGARRGPWEEVDREHGDEGVEGRRGPGRAPVQDGGPIPNASRGVAQQPRQPGGAGDRSAQRRQDEQ